MMYWNQTPTQNQQKITLENNQLVTRMDNNKMMEAITKWSNKKMKQNNQPETKTSKTKQEEESNY